MENPCFEKDESYCKLGICVIIPGNSTNQPLGRDCLCELTEEPREGEIFCPFDANLEPTTEQEISTESVRSTIDDGIDKDESFLSTVMEMAYLMLNGLILILLAVSLIVFCVYVRKKLDLMSRYNHIV